MFTCVIRYTVEPDRLDELRAYARSWIALIRKYGGEHHGYFMPLAGEAVPDATFSFPGRGVEAPRNIAYALFSFPSSEAYERYRTDVKAAAGKVDGVDFPEAAKAVNSYPIAQIKTGKNPSAGKEFSAFVLSPTGKAVLRQAGFEPAS